jgi:hypothetical protein
MHEGEGYLRIKGHVPNEDVLARLVGSTPKEVKRLLGELEKAGVPSRDNDGVLYSRRMVRDIERHRQKQAAGKKGGNPQLKREVEQPDNRELRQEVNQTLKQVLDEVDKPQSPYSRVHIPEKKETRARGALVSPPEGWPTDYWDQFWSTYPHQVGEKAAKRALDKVARNNEVSFTDLMAALHAIVPRPMIALGAILRSGLQRGDAATSLRLRSAPRRR